ncbi:MAG: ATP-binding protein [Mycoplasmataceae bacterium]|nr:ATP-binding protein [Mycoplasmataceae bacterium]
MKKFIGRKTEVELLKKTINSNKNEFVLVYGRRRVGKTELIKHLKNSFDGDFIYFIAEQTEYNTNLQNLTQIINSVCNHYGSFERIEDIFSFLYEESKNKKITIVLDEYPHLRAKKDGLDSILNAIWENNDYQDGNLKIIICGSYIDIMKNIISHTNPLYGRMTCVIKLNPMNYLESAQFYPRASNIEKVYYYSCFNGIPYYNSFIDDSFSFEENVKNIILNEHSILENEPQIILTNELVKIEGANTVLDVISNGTVKYCDILNKSKLPNAANLNYILNKLIDMELVKKTFPINQINNPKRTFYSINDRFLLFYYKYVFKKLSYKTIMPIQDFFNKYIKESFYKDYVPKAFEEICSQYLIYQSISGKHLIYEIGKYWYNDQKNHINGEIDLVAKNDDGYTAYECKFNQSRILTKLDMQDQIQNYHKLNLPFKKIHYFVINKPNVKINDIEFTTLSDIYNPK